MALKFEDWLKHLSETAPLEWARVFPSSHSAPSIPFVVWRHAATNSPPAQHRLADLVDKFSGNVEWEIYCGGRSDNCVIAPRRLRVFQQETGTDTDVKAAVLLANQEPDFAKGANADVSPLVERLIAMFSPTAEK